MQLLLFVWHRLMGLGDMLPQEARGPRKDLLDNLYLCQATTVIDFLRVELIPSDDHVQVVWRLVEKLTKHLSRPR